MLVVGHFADEIYEPSFCEGLRNAGADVDELRIEPHFGAWKTLSLAQQKYVWGPGVAAANRAFIGSCERLQPDVVLLWRTPWLLPGTIDRARRGGARQLVLYNNDDPFGPDRDLAIWRNYRRIIREADICLAYRPINLDEYRAAGARGVALLRSYFVPRLHHPTRLTTDERRRYECDVVFLGHGEPDDRLDLMDAVIETGLHVRLFGATWGKYAAGHRWRHLLPIANLRGDEYRKALAAAKIGLVFLSQRNRDQYTRRCFEIPAIGTMMLAPRTDELRKLFRENIEVVLYSSGSELAEAATKYAGDHELRERIAAAGRARVIADGHDVNSRAREFLRLIGPSN